jgi:hypothetical protein
VLCDEFSESWLRQAGYVAVYPGPTAIFAGFEASLLAR